MKISAIFLWILTGLAAAQTQVRLTVLENSWDKTKFLCVYKSTTRGYQSSSVKVNGIVRYFHNSTVANLDENIRLINKSDDLSDLYEFYFELVSPSCHNRDIVRCEVMTVHAEKTFDAYEAIVKSFSAPVISVNGKQVEGKSSIRLLSFRDIVKVTCEVHQSCDKISDIFIHAPAGVFASSYGNPTTSKEGEAYRAQLDNRVMFMQTGTYSIQCITGNQVSSVQLDVDVLKGLNSEQAETEEQPAQVICNTTETTATLGSEPVVMINGNKAGEECGIQLSSFREIVNISCEAHHTKRGTFMNVVYSPGMYASPGTMVLGKDYSKFNLHVIFPKNGKYDIDCVLGKKVTRLSLAVEMLESLILEQPVAGFYDVHMKPQKVALVSAGADRVTGLSTNRLLLLGVVLLGIIARGRFY